jgi:hypothetical protein
MALINAIEAARHSKVVCYITSDRQGSAAKIGMDIFPHFYDLLVKAGDHEQVDLFLYSTGGMTMAAWGLVNLIREFCRRFCVLIPFKAQSSATLISLGADEIVMTKMGQLSPVDPTITGPYNPLVPNLAPGAEPQFLPVSVEDVSSYFDLAKELGVKAEAEIADVFKTLSADVRPLAVGNVFRAKQQIKMLSEKLLNFHMGSDKQRERDGIVSKLVRELYSHDYLIGRTEAKNQIGLKVMIPTKEFEGELIELFRLYSDALQLTQPYDGDALLGSDSTKVVSLDSAFIESAEGTYIYRTKKELKRTKIAHQGMQIAAIQERVLQQSWILEPPPKSKGA